MIVSWKFMHISWNLMVISWEFMMISWSFSKTHDEWVKSAELSWWFHEVLWKPMIKCWNVVLVSLISNENSNGNHGCPLFSMHIQWRSVDSRWLALSFPLEDHGCSSIFYGIQQASTGNQFMGPRGSQGAPGSWRGFLSEPRPHSVLLRFMKPFELVVCVWSSRNFNGF